jgi:PIN domain nuclease of toxin-antitoxin system
VTAFLLDTDVVVKSIYFPERLSPQVRAALTDPANDRWVSVVSAFEIAVKIGIGKLPMPKQFSSDFLAAFCDVVDRFAARTLDVQLPHAARITALPLHHRDPFDRLLIAQAMVEDLTLVSGDRQFSRYLGLKVLTA